jgi:o-succinylbenzoate---CoA ligase
VEDWVARWARERPDHPAVGARTYAELDAAASQTARRLAALGVGERDVVATTPRPGFELAALLWAAPRLGAALMPVDPRQERPATAALVVDSALEGSEAAVRERSQLDPEAVHSVILTSGTTGSPKAVELTLANHAASAAGSAWLLGVAPDDRWLCPLPLFHVGGLAVLMRSALYGTTAIVHERFDVERVQQSLESGEATLASLVPTMLRRLRGAGLSQAPALRALLLGGGPAEPELLEWAWGLGLPVMATYGMTETASQIATADVGSLAGRLLPGAELRITEEGEILVRGPMVARGALAEDGWLHTGDLGSVDEGGLLHVQGRLKDVIVTGGENVSTVEVESVLLSHQAVLDAAVIGEPDPEWGEAVVAFVVAADGTVPSDLDSWCRDRLPGFKVPKRISLVRELPRNAAGKLLRDRLP